MLGLRSVGPNQPFICALRPTDYYPTISLKGRLSQEKCIFADFVKRKGSRNIHRTWGWFLIEYKTQLHFKGIWLDMASPPKWTPPPTVGQFGSSGCRIKSTSIFVIFSNEGWCSSISSVMTGLQNDNNFVLTPLHDGPRSGRRGPFLAKNLLFSTLRLYNPHFLVSDGPDSMGSYLPHILS